MSTRQFFIQRWEAEQPAFIKVLRAIPEGQLGYRPHERSASAGGLAWQLAEEQKQLVEVLDTGEIRFQITTHPATVAEIAAAWERATEELRKRLTAADDSQWSREGKFFMDGNNVWSDTLENMCWGYLFDMVHHRGQLSSYLRPMGGKVPAIYGPSADDSGS